MATVDQPGALVEQRGGDRRRTEVDPNPLNNSDAVSVNAAPAADLRVTKAVSDAAPGVGALVSYTIAVTNLGPNDATSAAVGDRAAGRCGVRIGVRPPRAATTRATGIWTLGAAAGDRGPPC